MDGKRIDKEFVDGILTLLQLTDKKEALPQLFLEDNSSVWPLPGRLRQNLQILLCDEPTGNLDTATSHDVMGLLKIVAKQFRQTIVLITHDNDIAQMADRIVQIEDGKIVKGSEFHAEKQ